MMTLSNTNKYRGFLVFFLLVFLFPLQNQSQKKESPGELSAVHFSINKGCEKCHDDDYEVPPAKCLTCHGELANRIKNKTGYHQDKDEGCSSCHVEHQGKKTKLFELDVKDFDHEETGYVLKGNHTKISDCRSCHRPPNSLKRKKSLSFLLKSNLCSACHITPHSHTNPKCMECHNQFSWQVEIW